MTTETTSDSLSIARQAIVDTHRSVIGYELFDRSRKADEHTASSDAQMLFNFLLSAQSGGLNHYPPLFINCTHASLASGHLDLVASQHIVLEIPPAVTGSAEEVNTLLPVLQKLHQRGFRFALGLFAANPMYAPWLQLASYFKLDTRAHSDADITQALHTVRQQVPAMQFVAEKVETEAQFLAMQQLGIQLFQGYWFAKPQLVAGHRVNTSQAAILQLINLVRQQASTPEIEEVLKRDPTLSFNLLRFINSASFGLRTEVTSFRHAVMLLGLQKLFKWAALLLTTTQANQSSPAVGSTAVVRGRMMELLLSDVESMSDEVDNAFVTGVFSMLDSILGIPMDTALAQLTLPGSINEALLLQVGPLAPYLQLVIACESEDTAAFDRLCTELNLSGNQVNWAHLQALAWAESLSA